MYIGRSMGAMLLPRGKNIHLDLQENSARVLLLPQRPRKLCWISQPKKRPLRPRPQRVTVTVITQVEVSICNSSSPAVSYCVHERDENEEAVRNVEKLTESEPVNGEDLLGSEELKRKLLEAKKELEESRKRHP